MPLEASSVVVFAAAAALQLGPGPSFGGRPVALAMEVGASRAHACESPRSDSRARHAAATWGALANLHAAGLLQRRDYLEVMRRMRLESERLFGLRPMQVLRDYLAEVNLPPPPVAPVVTIETQLL